MLVLRSPSGDVGVRIRDAALPRPDAYTAANKMTKPVG